MVALEAQVFGHRLTDGGIGAQHHDSGVVVAEAKFVFGANHAFRGLAAQCGFFNNQGFVATSGEEFGSDGGYGHFLAFGHIAGAAHDVQPFGGSYVDFGYAQTVGVGVLAHFADFTDDDSAQPARKGVKHLGLFNFESRSGKAFANFGDAEVCRKVVREPVQ